MFSLEPLLQQLLELFSSRLPAHGKVALVDYPDSANCGDHAIWLGEKELLARLGLQTAYECSAQKYNREEMTAAIGDGTILMHGGGNFGDRYPLYHEFRLTVLRDFPRNPIIVFPQQVTFLNNAYLQKTVSLYAEHPDVTLCARGIVAEQLMSRYFSPPAKVVLATDMAFMLGPQPRPIEPIYDVIWIARTDQEKTGWNWMDAVPGLAERPPERLAIPPGDDAIRFMMTARRRGSEILAADWYALQFADQEVKKAADKLGYDGKSRVYMSRALYILSLGHLVITDRLHGHILCLLLGIPHILLNNDSGKNWNFYDCWTRDSPLCQLARNPAEAWSLAQKALPLIKQADKPREAWSWQDALATTSPSGIRWG